MSFFGRAANLIKGGVKSLTRTSPEDELKERALAEELKRELDRVESRRKADAPKPASKPAPEPAPERGPPERDAHGNVKRTL